MKRGFEEFSRDEFNTGLTIWPLVASAWRHNIQCLSQRLNTLRYEAFSSPAMETYLPLISLRRTIANSRQCIAELVASSKHCLRKFEAYHSRPAQDGMRLSAKAFSHLVNELNGISEELNDEIHLIMGAVNIQDSAAMKQQAERATLLTLLAAVYLPLTLVTGIFGMNIKEINQGTPTFRACLAAFGVASASTLIFALCYHWRKRARRRHSKQRNPEENDAFKAV